MVDLVTDVSFWAILGVIAGLGLIAAYGISIKRDRERNKFKSKVPEDQRRGPLGLD